MEFKEFVSTTLSTPQAKELKEDLQSERCGNIVCSGVTGSYISLLTSILFGGLDRDVIAILHDREEASYFYDDLQRLGMEGSTLFFPSSFKRPTEFDKLDGDSVVLRTEVLTRLSQRERFSIVVTYPEAAIERVISSKDLQDSTLLISVKENIGLEIIEDTLIDFGFTPVDFVYEPGTFSVRGSIVDIFSFSHDEPFRVDLFGDEVESIREFDIETQRSIKCVDRVSIVPNIQKRINRDSGISIFEFVKDSTLLISPNLRGTLDVSERMQERALKVDSEGSDSMNSFQDLIVSPEELYSSIKKSQTLEYGLQPLFDTERSIQFNIKPQPVFQKNFSLLSEDISNRVGEGYQCLILSSSNKQLERLDAIFQDKKLPVQFTGMGLVLSQGFIDHDAKICCYTDHQIFDRYHRFRLRSKKAVQSTITLQDLSKFHKGDYVVHIDHGIGVFEGLVKNSINGKVQESIRLSFKDNDSLLVSIHSLHKISKYKEKEGSSPKINKLGSNAWQKLKDKTKKKVTDIAKDLIELYAKRKREKGFQFSEDSFMQQELEASFIYEDTPDQLKSTNAVKADMERETPMDRLVCGDVGFGKTEVAIRAAFKAVADSKQVAVLVPTTVLALQHYKTFKSRLKDFPCNIEYISRLRTGKELKRVLEDLKSGKVDIIIGTHKLVGKSVQFADLGLLIVDEEQKFGVGIKEKLKSIKVNVDTLALTATPIPRTLQFSLMGARDLSVINTPPPNRYPILTEVHGFNEEIIKEAIAYEMDRGGQVFFINNRIKDIEAIKSMVERIVPAAKVAVGHGQMEGSSLETLLLDFVAGEFDVLVATTIIESGLDIPNANTIIINNAQNFGLSELHQLRGRVGRSNKKAFCYLLAPPLSSLPSEGRKRLEAIETFSELGSGFSIAMQDLDIRGAGNILGSEQSGFIADIGFETYHKILNEAITDLKDGEYRGLFDKTESNDASNTFLKTSFVSDCQIDTDMEVRFPEYYVISISERMALYRELDQIKDEEELVKFEQSLVDRFGDIPEVSVELIRVVRLRWVALKLSIERISLKNSKMICNFVSDPESSFYQTPIFGQIVVWIQKNPNKVILKEGRQKLSLHCKDISSVEEAFMLLDRICSN